MNRTHTDPNNDIITTKDRIAIIIIKDGIPTTTSLAIASGTSTQHETVLNLISTHKTDLETFGMVAFGTLSFEIYGGTQKTEFAYLNERQSTIILTYIKNTTISREFKIRLNKAFYKMAGAQRSHPNLDMIQSMIDKSVNQAITVGLGKLIARMVAKLGCCHG
ncbi:MAG: Rha family transcriptional regulator [Magnetococcales bacterium]|nr:Rha family transcriptional regulator [Magnetococcales bacterium]